MVPLGGVCTRACPGLTVKPLLLVCGCSEQVTNANGGATSAAATLTVMPGPVITQQPTGVTVIVGGSVVFTAAATGNGALSYKWYKTTATTAILSSTASYTFTAALGE